MSAASLSARTAIGPLTTTFTPRPSCFVPTTAAGGGGYGVPNAFAAQACGAINADGLGPLLDATDCWPPASQGAPTPVAPFEGWGFYSPGFVCPAGYTRACTATGGGSSQWSVEYSMSGGETAVGCCPSGYTCTNIPAQTCYKGVAYLEDFALATCSSGMLTNFATVSLPYTTTISNYSGSTLTSQVSSYKLWNPLIEIRWQSSDSTLPGFVEATATGPLTPTSTTLTSSTTTAPATSSPTGKPSSGLSTGAQAGIGVGVALGALLLLGAGILFWCRSRRRLKTNTANHSEPESKSAVEMDLRNPPVYRQSQQSIPGDVPGIAPSEMDGSPRPPQEMDVPDTRHELPGSAGIQSN